MFGRRADRRVGYSFPAHLRRIIKTKGLTRVLLSVSGTAVIAAIAFAQCSTSEITGPTSSQGSGGGASAPPTTGSPKTVRVAMATTLPPESPCTGQPIMWDATKSFINVEYNPQLSTDGKLHIQFHLNSQAQGVTDKLRAPVAPVRDYVGSEEDNSQTMVFASGTERYKEEWNMKIIAKGEDGSLHPEDDFFLHIVSYLAVDHVDAIADPYCR